MIEIIFQCTRISGTSNLKYLLKLVYVCMASNWYDGCETIKTLSGCKAK